MTSGFRIKAPTEVIHFSWQTPIFWANSGNKPCVISLLFTCSLQVRTKELHRYIQWEICHSLPFQTILFSGIERWKCHICIFADINGYSLILLFPGFSLQFVDLWKIENLGGVNLTGYRKPIFYTKTSPTGRSLFLAVQRRNVRKTG